MLFLPADTKCERDTASPPPCDDSSATRSFAFHELRFAFLHGDPPGMALNGAPPPGYGMYIGYAGPYPGGRCCVTEPVLGLPHAFGADLCGCGTCKPCAP
eukprot:354691-Chlamydomonas_euryale.AAC.6